MVAAAQARPTPSVFQQARGRPLGNILDECGIALLAPGLPLQVPGLRFQPRVVLSRRATTGSDPGGSTARGFGTADTKHRATRGGGGDGQPPTAKRTGNSSAPLTRRQGVTAAGGSKQARVAPAELAAMRLRLNQLLQGLDASSAAAAAAELGAAPGPSTLPGDPLQAAPPGSDRPGPQVTFVPKLFFGRRLDAGQRPSHDIDNAGSSTAPVVQGQAAPGSHSPVLHGPGTHNAAPAPVAVLQELLWLNQRMLLEWLGPAAAGAPAAGTATVVPAGLTRVSRRAASPQLPRAPPAKGAEDDKLPSDDTQRTAPGAAAAPAGVRRTGLASERVAAPQPHAWPQDALNRQLRATSGVQELAALLPLCKQTHHVCTALSRLVYLCEPARETAPPERLVGCVMTTCFARVDRSCRASAACSDLLPRYALITGKIQRLLYVNLCSAFLCVPQAASTSAVSHGNAPAACHAGTAAGGPPARLRRPARPASSHGAGGRSRRCRRQPVG